MTITCGSLFSGIGGFEEGFRRAGIETLWSCEKDKTARAVLSKRFPNAIMLDDVCTADPSKLPKVDIVCGGFPCQDLSVAGKRAGLAGARSGLFHEAMRIVRGVRPSIVILENVPGLLSSNRGLDFAAVLREMGEGWDCAEVAWRVLDSQYFGVAQRRKRVFVVASSRVGCAEQILALAEGVCWDPPSRESSGEDTSTDTEGSTRTGGWMPNNPGVVGSVSSNYSTGGTHGLERESGISPPLKVGSSIGIPSPPAVAVMHTIDMQACKGHANIGDGTVSPTLCSASGNDVHAVAFRKSKRAQTVDDHETWLDDGLSNTLNGFDTGDTRTTHAIAFHPTQTPISSTDGSTHSLSCGGSSGCSTIAVSTHTIVRRLTPVECERLQGFPDGWTDIGTPEKPTADSHRYKQLGNAVTVNVAEWIGRRIAKELKQQ